MDILYKGGDGSVCRTYETVKETSGMIPMPFSPTPFTDFTRRPFSVQWTDNYPNDPFDQLNGPQKVDSQSLGEGAAFFCLFFFFW